MNVVEGSNLTKLYKIYDRPIHRTKDWMMSVGKSGFAVFAAFALLSCVGGYFIFRSSVADIVNEI